MERQQAVMAAVRTANEGKQLRAMVETYGCQQNVNDSQRLMGMLREMGYELCQSREEADVLILNTCAVRDNAEQKVFGHLGALSHLHKRKPGMILAVCGCMAQQESVAQHIRKRYRHVDLIFGTHALYRFPELLANVLEDHARVIDITGEGAICEGIPTLHDGGARAFVSVMYGCNNFCTYCIVPYVRGRERSRRMEDVLSEIRALVAQGVREVMLLGQNVNSYGKDLGMENGFATLLEAVNAIDGLYRIRFMSSHPKDISEELLETMARCDKVCRHLHLPIQSGSDRVLADMNRHYTAAHYRAIAARARALMDDISLSTDVIVGFPTETAADFEDTLQLLRDVEFDNLFSFIYSPRRGTPAATMARAATDAEIGERFQRLLDAQGAISLGRNERRIGQVQTVLVEGVSKHDAAMLTGRNAANQTVNFPGSASLANTLVSVRITRAQTWVLYGVLADSE